MPLIGEGVAGLLLVLFWLFCIYDVIAADATLVRNIHKTLWLTLVVFLPTVGGVAWLVLGRPQGVGYSPGSTTYRQQRRMIAPEDDPKFMDALEEKKRLEKWEKQLTEREEKLRRDEEGDQGAEK